MAKKYFIWKDPACNGMDIEWVELNGRAFYDLLKKPENGERRFILPCLLNCAGVSGTKWDLKRHGS